MNSFHLFLPCSSTTTIRKPFNPCSYEVRKPLHSCSYERKRRRKPFDHCSCQTGINCHCCSCRERNHLHPFHQWNFHPYPSQRQVELSTFDASVVALVAQERQSVSKDQQQVEASEHEMAVFRLLHLNMNWNKCLIRPNYSCLFFHRRTYWYHFSFHILWLISPSPGSTCTPLCTQVQQRM